MKIQAALTESGAQAALATLADPLHSLFPIHQGLQLSLNAPGIPLGALGVFPLPLAFLFCCGR